PYAIFGFVILAIALAGAIPLHQRLVAWAPDDVRPWIDAAFAYGALAGGVHLAHLVRARLRSTLFRGLVSIPGMVFIAVGALSGLWLLALLPLRGAFWLAGWNHGLVALRWLDLLPVAVGVASVGTSLRSAKEIVRIPLGNSGPEEVTRLPVQRYRRRTPAPRPARVAGAADRADHGPAPGSLAAGAPPPARRRRPGRPRAGSRPAHGRLPHHGGRGKPGRAGACAGAPARASRPLLRDLRQPRP